MICAVRPPKSSPSVILSRIRGMLCCPVLRRCMIGRRHSPSSTHPHTTPTTNWNPPTSSVEADGSFYARQVCIIDLCTHGIHKSMCYLLGGPFWALLIGRTCVAFQHHGGVDHALCLTISWAWAAHRPDKESSKKLGHAGVTTRSVTDSHGSLPPPILANGELELGPMPCSCLSDVFR